MPLSKLEQETIILFNEKEKTADVYTHNTRIKKRLRELHQQRPNDIKLARTDGETDTYIVPKVWIRINPPRTVAPLTEEQRAQRAEQLQAIKSNLRAPSRDKNPHSLI